MEKRKNHITVFEHSNLRVEDYPCFTKKVLSALEKFHGVQGTPYFKLIHRGVRFKSYVGVLQIGKITIEILPKADKNPVAEADKKAWSRRLIAMLKAVGAFKIHAPSSSALSVRRNFILDLYFELYVTELEYLPHRGLVKKYRKVEGNRTALKGSLNFSRHISENLVHKERFFVRHTTYDKDHLLHRVLYQGLQLLNRLNTNAKLQSRIGSLLLTFPEMPDLKVTENTFRRIKLNRKTEVYGKALNIARLLLLNYHPDLSTGRQHVLALMFDMNLLWERFVYVSLRKHLPDGWHISPQNSKSFWAPENGSVRNVRPDIMLTRTDGKVIVLDTKWKNINDTKVSIEDLRQMYVYLDFYLAERVALIFPGDSAEISGHYYHPDGTESEKVCELLFVPPEETLLWQEQIAAVVFKRTPAAAK